MADSWEEGREEDIHKGRNRNHHSGRGDGEGGGVGDARANSMDNLDTLSPQALIPQTTWMMQFGTWWPVGQLKGKR